MAESKPDLTALSSQRHMALSRWETEGNAGPPRGSLTEAELAEVPDLTGAELVHLRIRVIALENMLISLLAQASDQQLGCAREMAAYIFPRPGFTQHPLTIRAAHQMIDLVERSAQFKAATPA